MELITQNLWIGFFVAAYLLHKTRPGNSALVLGLAGLGVPSFLRVVMSFLWRREVHDSAFFWVVQSLGFMQVGAIVLLIYGVARLVRSPGGGEVRLLDSAATNLSTLFIPRNTSNTHSRAVALRDAACERLIQASRRRGTNVIEQKSNAHSPTVWFRLDYLLPQPTPELSLRAHVEVTVDRFDYHRFEHLFSIQAQVGSESTRIEGIIDLDDSIAERIDRYIVEPGSRLRIPERVRDFPLQLWRPHNNVDRLRPNWLTIGLGVVGGLLFLVPLVGWLLGLGVFLALYIRRRRRRTYVLTTGKPTNDPRSLRWMDSWQATVGGLGPSALQVSDGIMSRLAASAPPELVVSVEHIGYWSVDNRVERDQVAVRYRRAIGFIQIIPHGANLYVSWEAHLNMAAWAEQTLARGLDRQTGLDVHANRVVSGVQALNEYDLADSNFLAEWIHESVKQVVKLKMVEHEIDQEIDFTIQRESRHEAVGAGENGKTPLKRAKAVNRFKRVA
jgi:hypothetical protein